MICRHTEIKNAFFCMYSPGTKCCVRMWHSQKMPIQTSQRWRSPLQSVIRTEAVRLPLDDSVEGWDSCYKIWYLILREDVNHKNMKSCTTLER
jgi:hypothetical protein